MHEIITSHATHPALAETHNLGAGWTAVVLLVLAVLAGATLYGLYSVGYALMGLLLACAA